MARIIVTLFLCLIAPIVLGDGDYKDRDRQPIITSAPEYPVKARRERWEGKVVVCFTIDSAGRIRKPYILSSTHRIFEKAALRSVKASLFEPATEDQDSLQKTCRSFDFRLNPVDNTEQEQLVIQPPAIPTSNQ